jgi:hypothetical protein
MKDDYEGFISRSKASIFLVLAIAMLILPGCSGNDIKPFLDNLHTDCKRDYTFSIASGGVGGVGASGTVTGNIHCDPLSQPVTPAPVPATP